MVKIITDTTSCLTGEFSQRYDIPIIPQVINFGEDSYYEGLDMDIHDFMQRLKLAKSLPKTAAPPPELFSAQFQRLASSCEPILCIHPSSEVSGTVRSATVAAKDFPDLDIRILDTRVVGSPIGSLVKVAATMAVNGDNIDTIENHLTALIPRCRIFFMVATLDYLAKGGRIGGAAALLGSVLQIKPILTMRDGRVDVFERERTHRRAIARLIELTVEDYPDNSDGYLTVMHAGVPDEGHSLADELCQRLNLQSIPIYNVPPAIVTHGGPGILAVAFFSATN